MSEIILRQHHFHPFTPVFRNPKLFPTASLIFFDGSEVLITNRHHLLTLHLQNSIFLEFLSNTLGLSSSSKYTDKRKSCLMPLFVLSESLQHTPPDSAPTHTAVFNAQNLENTEKHEKKRIPKSTQMFHMNTHTYRHTPYIHHCFVAFFT